MFITKPFTSRPANSEKYVICKQFRGINANLLNILQYNLRNWDNNSFVSFITYPNWFLNLVKKYNQNFIKIK